jgi:hypothetical protein
MRTLYAWVLGISAGAGEPEIDADNAEDFKQGAMPRNTRA